RTGRLKIISCGGGSSHAYAAFCGPASADLSHFVSSPRHSPLLDGNCVSTGTPTTIRHSTDNLRAEARPYAGVARSYSRDQTVGGLQALSCVSSSFWLAELPRLLLMRVSPQTTRIGWFGTGVMGRSMCGHLLSGSYPVTVYTRSREKAADLVARG